MTRRKVYSSDGLERMHVVMAGYVDRGEIPGVVTLLSRNGEVHADMIGTVAFGNNTPICRDTIFRIASLTKPVAGAAAMMLVEGGKISLGEPVDRLLPELADRRVLKRLDGPLDETVPAERPILISDLLTLRMGMGVIFSPEPYPIMQAMREREDAVKSMDEYVAAIGELPLMRQPGEAWMYDTGLNVLGVLIERAAAQPLGDFLEARIFAPLGMSDTGFHVPEDKLDRLPTCYWRNYRTGDVEVFDPAGPESHFARPPGFASLAGGLVSTVDDYLAFATAMLNQGEYRGTRLLSQGSVERMTFDHITPEQKANSPFAPGFWAKRGWGLGLCVMTGYEPGDPRGTGWDGGYGTSAYWDRDSALIGILMTQRLWESPAPPAVNVDFWRTAYEAIDI